MCAAKSGQPITVRGFALAGDRWLVCPLGRNFRVAYGQYTNVQEKSNAQIWLSAPACAKPLVICWLFVKSTWKLPLNNFRLQACLPNEALCSQWSIHFVRFEQTVKAENGNEPHKAVKVHRPCQPENDGHVTVNIMALPNSIVEKYGATNSVFKQTVIPSLVGQGQERSEFIVSPGRSCQLLESTQPVKPEIMEGW